MADARVQCFDDAFRSVFVEESEADAESDDREDDDRVGPLADDERCDRGRREQDQQGVAQLAAKYRQRPGTMAPDRMGPEVAGPAAPLLSRESGLGAFQPVDDLCGEQSGSFDESDS